MSHNVARATDAPRYTAREFNAATDDFYFAENGRLAVRRIDLHATPARQEEDDDDDESDEDANWEDRVSDARVRAIMARHRSDSYDVLAYDSDGEPRGDRDYDEEMDYQGYEDDTTYRAPRVPVKWRFLRWFFDQFDTSPFYFRDAHRVHTDAVRVGRDPDDWWISVLFDDCNPTERANHYRAIRGAIMLHAVVARVDYDAFLSLLIRRSRVDVPSTMDLTTPGWQLPRQFTFHLGGEREDYEYSWRVLQDLFGNAHHHEDFREHLQTILKMAQSDSTAEKDPARVRRTLLAPVPIKFVFKPELFELPEQVGILTNITKTVQQIRAIEEKWHSNPVTEEISSPVFHLDSIELDLRNFTLHSAMLTALAKLLKTGVRITSLTMPELVLDDGNDDAKRHLMWAYFVRMVLGTRPAVPTASVQVERLVLPPTYTINEYIAPFASALRDASLLKSLCVEMRTTANTNPGHILSVWLWLAYALFSRDSQSSIEALEVNGHQLSPGVLGMLTTQVRSPDPLGVVWSTFTSHHPSNGATARDSTGRYPYAVLKEGAKIRLLDQNHHAPLTLPNTWRGQIVREDAKSPTLGMLLPGFGICIVNRSDVMKRGHLAHTDHRTDLKTLIFDAKRGPRDGRDSVTISTRQFLPRVLELAGASLTSLAWKADDVDDHCVEMLVRYCPQLDSLLLDGAQLTTLRALTTAYDHGTGGRPSSLALRNMRISRTAVDDLLQCLATPGHKIQRRLRRVAIGKGWSKTFDGSTPALLDQALEHNRFLSHLIVYTDYTLRWYPQHGPHHGAVIPKPLTTRVASQAASVTRLAAVSAMKHAVTASEQVSMARRLTPDVLALVFEFAAPHCYRTVLRRDDHEVDLFSLLG